jgi:hypothetical protein
MKHCIHGLSVDPMSGKELCLTCISPASPASPSCYVALSALVEAWDSLPDGHYSPDIITEWLVDDMKPVIDVAREALAAQKSRRAT